MPRGTHNKHKRSFRPKRELQFIFLDKKVIIITSKHGTTIFFFPLQSFYRKTWEKLARKSRVITDGVYRIVLMPLVIP